MKTIQKSYELSIIDINQQRKIAEGMLLKRKLEDSKQMIVNLDLGGLEDQKQDLFIFNRGSQ